VKREQLTEGSKMEQSTLTWDKRLYPERTSQNGRILDCLRMGLRLTPLVALSRFGCLRLSGRIYDLRHMGWNIQERRVADDGKHYSSYWLDMEDR